MRLTRRATALAVVCTLIAAASAGCTSDDDGATADPTQVVIGADLASGTAVDTAYARALRLRLEQINASGTLGDVQLVLRIQDNGSDSTASLRNIGTLADDPSVVALITGACNECVVNASKTINDKQLPTIALAAANQVTTPVAERRFIFKIGPNAADSAAALVAELSSAKINRVAVLHSDDLYGRGANDALAAELSKARINLTATRAVKPAADDLTQAVGTLVDSQPGALLVLVGPDQATLAATSAKAAKFAGRVYFDANAAGDMFIPPDAAPATNGATMVFTQILAIDDVIATTPAKASRKQWFRDYTARYGSYSGVASFAADAADLIADAVAQVGADRAGLRDVIETSQLDGLSGPIRLTPDNHSGLMPQGLTMLVARSGRWRLQS